MSAKPAENKKDGSAAAKQKQDLLEGEKDQKEVYDFLEDDDEYEEFEIKDHDGGDVDMEEGEQD